MLTTIKKIIIVKPDKILVKLFKEGFFINTSDLKQEFTKAFDTKPERVFFSPDRINLIGEHADYNGGHVFPCAITIGTYGVYAPRMSTTFHMTKPLVGQIILRSCPRSMIFDILLCKKRV